MIDLRSYLLSEVEAAKQAARKAKRSWTKSDSWIQVVAKIDALQTADDGPPETVPYELADLLLTMLDDPWLLYTANALLDRNRVEAELATQIRTARVSEGHSRIYKRRAAGLYRLINLLGTYFESAGDRESITTATVFADLISALSGRSSSLNYFEYASKSLSMYLQSEQIAEDDEPDQRLFVDHMRGLTDKLVNLPLANRDL